MRRRPTRPDSRSRRSTAGNWRGCSAPIDGDDANFGKPEVELTAQVDVAAYTEQKRAAMRAHASQISEESFFLAMPEDVFAYSFGVEWFIRLGQGPGITETDLMTGV